jgi:tripartite-type tricarboxylate transporter receptor subunit TctC
MFLAAVLALAVPFGALAQSWPTKPITIIVPYPPGATTDLMARQVGQKLNEALGQPVVVENKGGASGMIGTALVAKSAPDGYTIGLGTDATHLLNPLLYKEVQYDALKGFVPLTLAADNIIVLAVHPSVPAKNVAELIEYGKKNPGKLSYGSSGKGSPHHLAGELMQQLVGVKLEHVPYRGGGPAMTDLIGGHIPMAFLSLAAVVPHMNSGAVKVLAVVGASRYKGIPDVPTVGETIKGFDVPSWLAFFAPAGTPKPIADRLNAEIVKALRAEDVRTKLETAGLAVVASPPEALAEAQRAGHERWSKVVTSAGIQPE